MYKNAIYVCFFFLFSRNKLWRHTTIFCLIICYQRIYLLKQLIINNDHCWLQRFLATFVK